MPGSVEPDEELEWERRAGRVAGAAAIVGAVLLVLGGVLNARVSETLEYDRYLRLDSDHSLIFLPNLAQALGYIAVAVALYYLARATAARRSEMAGPMRVMSVLGPVANALSSVLLTVAILKLAQQVGDLKVPRGITDPPGGASGLLGNKAAGEKAVQDLQTDSGLWTTAAYVALAANLALGFALVLVSLNAMRAGLLSRFLGILGIIAGVLTVLFRGAGIIEAFWLAAVGVIFLGRWPGGRGPAWDAVESIPWPTAMDRQREAMEARAEELGADDDSDDEDPDDEVEELDAEPLSDNGTEPAERPHPVSKKRKKRKRR
jgi:hypothetical protein